MLDEVTREKVFEKSRRSFNSSWCSVLFFLLCSTTPLSAASIGQRPQTSLSRAVSILTGLTSSLALSSSCRLIVSPTTYNSDFHRSLAAEDGDTPFIRSLALSHCRCCFLLSLSLSLSLYFSRESSHRSYGTNESLIHAHLL